MSSSLIVSTIIYPELTQILHRGPQTPLRSPDSSIRMPIWHCFLDVTKYLKLNSAKTELMILHETFYLVAKQNEWMSESIKSVKIMLYTNWYPFEILSRFLVPLKWGGGARKRWGRFWTLFWDGMGEAKNVWDAILPAPYPRLHPTGSPHPFVRGPGVGRKSTEGAGLRKGAGLGEAPSLLCRLRPQGPLGAPPRACARACARGSPWPLGDPEGRRRWRLIGGCGHGFLVPAWLPTPPLSAR